MNQEQFKTLVKGMKAVYTQTTFIPDNDAVLVWYELLKDLPYSSVSSAIQKHMCSSTFPPTIADIRKFACESITNEFMNEMEAWNIVYKAICNSGYHSESEFKKLPPIIQKVVGSPSALKEWSQMDIDTVQSVERSHFVRAYRSVIERAKQDIQMPESINQRIETSDKREKIEQCV